jgi:hypothetical protein
MGGRSISHALKLFIVSSVFVFGIFAASRAQAACGAVQCFVVIGSQQAIPLKGLLTVNTFYNYTPWSVQEGTSGLIPHANQQRERLTLDNHKEIRTILQTYTLDLSYGVTDRFGVQVTVPYVRLRHKHLDEVGELNGGAGEELVFSDNGIGDIRLTGKYIPYQTLRSTLVTGIGVSLPTGDFGAKDRNGTLMEPTLQVGRGQVGLIGSIYQTYDLIPNRLNQFFQGSYRHTFRNSDGYQFGDEYLLNAGFNLVTVSWLVLTNQVNYRYMTHDNMNASLRRSLNPTDAGFPGDPITIDPTVKNRAVPNTGSTYLAYTPGFLINLGETTQFYFFAQIPVARDFNDNLSQGISYVFGLTKYFQVPQS